MKIEKINQNQLKVALSCSEILQMNLEIDSENSQNMLTKLLHSLESEFHFSIINQKITLEMVPSSQEGCNIFLTKTESEMKKTSFLKKILILSVEQLSTAEHIISSANFMHKIYQMNGLFYLVIYLENNQQRRQFQLLFSDFGLFIENPVLFESVLMEYGTLLSVSRIQ